MNPLSGIFGAGVAVRNLLYDRGVFEQKRLEGPVVSIGNLCVGGTGKTPFTQLLGDLLLRRGVKFDVLTRGYGRSSTDIRVVDPHGTPRDFGDEPLLIANHFAAESPDPPRVIVGIDRYQAGRFAEKQFGPRLHLLDDGFQHRRLARDFDIVLLAPDDADQVLLPNGRLREPLHALKRADAIVATEAVNLDAFPVVPPRVWRVDRDIVVPAEITPGKRVLAFCGIARPHRFFADLRRHGIYPVHEIIFRDHHRYNASDVHRIQREVTSSRADCCVTTIKDKMNLGELVAQLAPTYAVELTMTLHEQDKVVSDLLRIIEDRRRSVTA